MLAYTRLEDLQISGIIFYLANLHDDGNSTLNELTLKLSEVIQVSPHDYGHSNSRLLGRSATGCLFSCYGSWSA